MLLSLSGDTIVSLSRPILVYLGYDRIMAAVLALAAWVVSSWLTTLDLGKTQLLLELASAFAAATFIVSTYDFDSDWVERPVCLVVFVTHACHLFFGIYQRIDTSTQTQSLNRTKLFSLLVTYSMLILGYFAIPTWYTKAGAIWLLALHLIIEGSDIFSIVGLLFCSLGDILLELEDEGGSKELFIGGLGAFLIAHVMYLQSFRASSKRGTWSWLHPSTVRVALPCLTVVYASLLSVVVPRLPSDLLMPVVVYGLAISAMVLFSIDRLNRSSEGANESNCLAVIGAFVFMSSDILIALNKFVVPFHRAKLFVMTTYYFGQICIALSFVWPEGIKFRKGV